MAFPPVTAINDKELASISLLGDLRENFQDNVVAKGFLCSTS